MISPSSPSVVSTNKGRPKEYSFNGTTIRSSMRRSSDSNGIHVTFKHVVGDEFDAAKLHGIRESVVYAIGQDVFANFAKLISRPVETGSLGENLTMDHLNEREILIGDEYEVGTVRLKVTGPRSPCNRLNFIFQTLIAQESFVEVGRPGVYFEVLQEGSIKPGDKLTLVKSHHSSYTVADLFRLWKLQREVSLGRRDLNSVQHEFRSLVEDESVSEFLRARFRKSLV